MITNPVLELLGTQYEAGSFIIDRDNQQILWGPQLEEFFGWDTNSLSTLNDWSKQLHSEEYSFIDFLDLYELHGGRNHATFSTQDALSKRYFSISLSRLENTHQTVVLVQDVSHKFELEERSLEQLQTLKAIFKTSGTALALLDNRGRFLQINPAMETLLGYGQTAMYKQSFKTFTHPEDIAIGLEALAKLANNEVSQVVLEKRYIHKNGEPIYVQVIANTILDKEGNTKYLLSQLRDITDAKKKDLAQEESARKMQQTISKLQIKNNQLKDFGNLVSHNLRTPAGNLKMICELLQNSNTDEERQEWLKALETSTEELLGTLDELVELVRYTDEANLQPEKIYLQEILGKTLSEHKMRIKEIDPIITSDFTAASFVHYPKVYLQSIFSNLISNSFKYRDENRRLKITVTSLVQHSKTILKFTDNGIGIDLEKYGDRLFKLNQTFSDREDSKGFGLYMVHRQLQVMGGNIECHSVPDAGTTFTVTL